MKNDYTEQVLKDIAKEYGENIIGDGQSVIDDEPEIISVSPSLDIGLNGGIACGSFFIISGKPKLGKTTTALTFAANCQAKGMPVFYMNIEHRLKARNIKGTRSLKHSKPHFNTFQSAKNEQDDDEEEKKKKDPITILTAQHFLNLGLKILHSVPGCLLIFDSFSAMVEAAEIDGGVGTSTRGGGAKLLSQFCRDAAPILAMQKSIVVGILHIMANTSGYGAPTMEKSGNAVQYQLDSKIKGKSESPWIAGNKIIGQTVTWEIAESGLGPPGMQVESKIRYGIGVDALAEQIKIAIDLGLIEQAKAWFTLTYMQYHLDLIECTVWDKETMKKVKAQGEENLYQLLQKNPVWIDKLHKAIAHMMKAQ